MNPAPAWLQFSTPPRPAQTTYRPIPKGPPVALPQPSAAVLNERAARMARKAALDSASDTIVAQELARQLTRGTSFEPHEVFGRRRFAALLLLRHGLWRELRDRGWTYDRIGRACAMRPGAVHAAIGGKS